MVGRNQLTGTSSSDPVLITFQTAERALQAGNKAAWDRPCISVQPLHVPTAGVIDVQRAMGLSPSALPCPLQR